MVDEEFKNQSITISRDEMAEVFAKETAGIIIHIQAKMKGTDLEDPVLVHKIQEALLSFGADIMTQLFDTGKLETLEIDGED